MFLELSSLKRPTGITDVCPKLNFSLSPGKKERAKTCDPSICHLSVHCYLKHDCLSRII